MSQYVSSQIAGGARGSVLHFLGFITCLITMFAVILMIGNAVHSYKYPNPMGYICEGHDGIVLSRSSGRKSRAYKLDGERVSSDVYHSCEYTELPHP